jgi:hypothetical protein
MPAEVTHPEDAIIFMSDPVIPSIATWDQCSSGDHDLNATTFTLHPTFHADAANRYRQLRAPGFTGDHVESHHHRQPEDSQDE